MPDFKTWYVQINNETFTEVILPVDADEVLLVCHDDDWLICDIPNPSDSHIPFPILASQHWSLVLMYRRTRAGTIIGYAKSTSKSDIILHCFNSSPIPFTGVVTPVEVIS